MPLGRGERIKLGVEGEARASLDSTTYFQSATVHLSEESVVVLNGNESLSR